MSQHNLKKQFGPSGGRLRRDLGTLESYAALIGILIGAGIFKVTSQAWAITGPSVILGYVILLPVVLATDRAEARAIGNGHTTQYLRTDNYRNNLLRLGWKLEDLEPPGSDELFDAVVAWGDVAAVQQRVRRLFNAGADQVVLNLITKDRSVPYHSELTALASLNSM